MARIPYASAIGSLMYAMVCTRPNHGHAVGAVSRFMSNPGKAHWDAIKWILRYLRDTTKKCLYFGKGEIKVEGYVDADFAGELTTEEVQLVIYLLLLLEQLVGCREYKKLSLYPQQRLGM